MKKIITLLLFIGVYISTYSQMDCNFDNYRKVLKKNYGNDIDKNDKDFKVFSKSQKGKFSKGSFKSVTIPVVFHVIHNGEFLGQGSNISEGVIREQLAILNNDFSQFDLRQKLGFGTPTDSKIRFCLAKTDPFGQPTNGITRSFGKDYYSFDNDNFLANDNFIKQQRWPSNIYLNVYITDIRCAGEGAQNDLYCLGGYASPPEIGSIFNDISGEGALLGSRLIDGVVMNYRFFGSDPNYVGPDRTSVLTHEIGHWLGLYHIFGRLECDLYDDGTPECYKYGDEICDTPPIFPSSREADIMNFEGDNRVRSECTGNIISSNNFMDYAEELNFFTEQQAERMHEKTAFYRREIYNETYLNTENCTLTFANGNGGGGSGSGEYGTCNETNDDPYAFKIRSEDSGSFGKSLSIDDGILAVADMGTSKVHIYKIEDDCKVKVDAVLYQRIFLFARHVYVQKGKIFVSAGDHTVFVFEKKEGIWSLEQTIVLSAAREFGKNILLRGDELIITSEKKIFFYEQNGNNYELVWAKNLRSNITSNDNSALVFNGKFIAVAQNNYPILSSTIKLYFKNGSGGYDFNIKHGYNKKLYLTDSPDNKLYVYPNGLYDLNTYNPLNGDVTKVDDFYFPAIKPTNSPPTSYRTKIEKIYIQNSMIILPRLGWGTSFHDINNPKYYTRVNDGDSGDSFLRPSPYYTTTTLGRTSSLSGNHLVVGNWYCNEVYIYSLSSLILQDYDFQFCEMPPGDVVSGRNIEIGLDKGACPVEFISTSNMKTIRATNSISIKPGTHIEDGYSFIVEPNCNLAGGTSISNKTSLGANLYLFNEQYINITDDEVLDDVVISPNPSKGIIEIVPSEGNIVVTMTLFDFSGASLLHYKNEKNKTSFELDLSSFPSGLYIINFEMLNGSVISKKIIKE